MAKLTIIVPVYNTAKYLSRCLSSLENQSCAKELKIIIVNDGSMDNSQEIIDDYVNRNPSFFYAYKKENGGLSDARNFGLKFVNTPYLAFLDSDDWVDKDLYQHGINYMDQNSGCDFVNINFVEEKKLGPVFIDCKHKFSRNKYFIPVMAWNKIFLTEFWRKHEFKFKFGIKHEDVELIPKIIYHSSKFGFLNNRESLLHYDCTNKSSITRSKRDYQSWLAVFDSLKDFCNIKGDNELRTFIATTLFYQLVLFGGNPYKSIQVYNENRLFFDSRNIISKLHLPVRILQGLYLDKIILFLVMFSIHRTGFTPK